MKRRLCGIFTAAALGLAAACTPTTAPLANGNKFRHLTAGEIALARPIFGDSMNYKLIRVYKNAGEARSRAYNNGIYMRPRLYRDDYAQSRNSYIRSQFIHEMAHHWQAHNGTNLAGEAVELFFKHGGNYDRAYDYDLSDLANFENLSIEQQASIIEHYFLFNETATHWKTAETCRKMEQRANAIKGTFPNIPINPVCKVP